MLDERDIQIISQLLDQKLDQKLSQQKKEIMHEVNLLMEGYFDPKFNHLVDAVELLREKIVGQEDLEKTADRLDVLETVVKVHSREIEKLKESNHIA